MNKNIFVILLIIILCFILMSAFINNAIIPKPYTYVDEETGVNYIVLSKHYKGGICPRYNSDGSIYVTNINK